MLSCQPKTDSTDAIIPSTENNLTVFFIPTPFGINWNSPRKLFNSIALNYFSLSPHFMGHVAVHLSCTDLSQQQHELTTGMTHKEFPAVKNIFVEKSGLGVMFAKYPGKMDGPKVKQTIIQLLKNPGTNPGISFLRFKISAAACTRIVTYMKEYKENNLERYYSLYSRPLYGEGAGCSAFGASFLQVAGLMTQELEAAWTINLQLPKKLIGRPFIEQDVAFWKVITDGQTWGSNDDTSEDFTFWEPDRMHQWASKIIRAKALNSSYQVIQIYKAQGLYLDASLRPVPFDPIWKKTDRPYFSELVELNKKLYQNSL